MRNGSFADLNDRGVVFVGGAEAESFLQNIVTTDMSKVTTGHAGFGALLSPQGKIMFEFIIMRSDEGYLFDLPRATAAAFIKRMTLYRLRAKVEIADRSESQKVTAFWGCDALPDIDGAAIVPDPRLAALGFRAIVPKDVDLAPAAMSRATETAYHAHRIQLGVPEVGRDVPFGEAFPHDVDMDDLGGLDFRKGCYVGQEIVSRMEHRGTARRRAVQVLAEAGLPATGSSIEAGGKPIGTLGSVDGSAGIALIRLDRARRALDQGVPITVDGMPLTVTLPNFARFGWPDSAAEEEGAA